VIAVPLRRQLDLLTVPTEDLQRELERRDVQSVDADVIDASELFERLFSFAEPATADARSCESSSTTRRMRGACSWLRPGASTSRSAARREPDDRSSRLRVRVNPRSLAARAVVAPTDGRG
jgi:hypothetical protein